MKIKSVIGIFSAFFALLLFTGCVRDYRAEAAEDAREYLLKNMEGLSVLQQNFIRYNDPIILNTTLWESVVPAMIQDAHIVTRHERNIYKDRRLDMMMHCFGWRVPGMEKDILVVGTAQRDFRFWEVNRIVMRSREKVDQAGMKIRTKALSYAVLAYPGLEGSLLHRVRFTTPAVHTTLFILDQPVKEQKSDSWLDFLKMSEIEEPLQVSAVWTDPVTKRSIVVIGVSADKELTTWTPVRTAELTEKESKTYIGSKYTVFPKDSEDPFSQSFKKEESKKRKTGALKE